MKLNTFILRVSIILAVLTASAHLVNAQSDTLYPAGTITPFNVPDNTIVTAQLQHGLPVGDINGDGTTDFVFSNLLYDSTQSIGKSIVITDINHPENGTVLNSWQANIEGIGDFNGDGYDDLLDLYNWYVLFGNASGENFDTLWLNGQNSNNMLLYHADIDGDGKSEIVYVNSSVYVLSYGNPNPVFVNIHNGIFFMGKVSLFDIYDYDNDGVNELFIAFYDFSENRYDYGWYTYDTASNQYECELYRYRYVKHEPSVYFTSFMSDVNGDGLKDMCHDYYVSGEGFNLEVYLANPDTPYQYYYDTAVDIPMGVNNRLLYCAGDLNGDGADDWYSKESVDTLVVFYGNQNVVSEGFTKQTYPAGNNQLYMPSSKFQNYSTTAQPPLFDYNNDGKNDILLDYWTFDQHNRYQTVGNALITGSEALDFSNPAVIHKNLGNIEPGGMFGSKIRNAGDFNHDGYDDWAIASAYGQKLNIYYGGPGELDFTPDLTILLPEYPLTQLYDVAFGDLNGDGWQDIAVSSSSSSNVNMAGESLSTKGNVYLYFGKANMADTLYAADADKDFTNGESRNTYSLGRALNIVGDYNADGYNDLVVKSQEPRKALVFFGGVQMSDEADMLITVYTTGFSTTFAMPVTACGDINDDGFDDFTLGDAPHSAGRSLVYYGGTDADNQFDLAIDNPNPDGRGFGDMAVDNQGDFNDDGNPDLAIWNYDTNAFQIFFGGANFDSQPDLMLSDTSQISYITAVEYVPDFSTKGRADLLVSNGYTQNNLVLFYGTDTDKTKSDVIFYNGRGNVYGLASGDFNKDGYIDVLTGNTVAITDNKVMGGVVQHYISPTLTGVKNHNTAFNTYLNLFPNPAKDYISVQIKGNSNQPFTATLIDNKGMIVMSKKIAGNSSRFFIGDLANGIYLIRVTGNGNSLTKKFVKTY